MTEYFSSPFGTIAFRISNDYLTELKTVSEISVAETALSILGKEVQSQISAYAAGKLKNFNLPLQPSGTDFQQSVWEELLKIPYGQTISYKQLALRLGDEKKIRAAAAANGKNPIWVVIPCHRVIASDGKLQGYAGGLELKARLLAIEKAGPASLF